MLPPDEELIELCKEFRDGLLGKHPSDGCCAVVCMPLAGYLSFLYRVDVELMESDLGHCNHIWLRLPDGRALDPTGDQFNWCNDEKMPPIYLGPPIKVHAEAKPWTP